jgi:hypothetical protein
MRRLTGRFCRRLRERLRVACAVASACCRPSPEWTLAGRLRRRCAVALDVTSASPQDTILRRLNSRLIKFQWCDLRRLSDRLIRRFFVVSGDAPPSSVPSPLRALGRRLCVPCPVA